MNKQTIGRILIGFGAFAGVMAYREWKRCMNEEAAVPQTSGKPVTHPEQQTNQTEDMNTDTNLPRGYRNNNPLNIRISNNAWKGKVKPNTDGVFEQFTSTAYGYRAAMVLIRTYINRYNCNTLAKIIERWAPPSENSTASYIANVAKRMGVSAATFINPYNREQIESLMYAMSISENGTNVMPDTNAISEAWEMLYGKE